MQNSKQFLFFSFLPIFVVVLALWLSSPTSVDAKSTFAKTMQTYGTLKGNVTDAATGDVLIGATIKADRKTSTMTDIDGNYQLKLNAGKHTIEVNYVGYTTKKITDIEIIADAVVLLNVQLVEDSATLDDVLISVAQPQTKKEKGATRATESAERNMPAKPQAAPDNAKKAMPKATAPSPPTTSNQSVTTSGAAADISVQGQGAVSQWQAPTQAAPPPPAAPPVYPASIYDPIPSYDLTIANNAPEPAYIKASLQAGLLTAGEVNDFTKWNMWQDITTDILADEQQQWQFRAMERYVVQLTTEGGDALIDQAVSLVADKGQTVWQARTDNTGKAELWANLFTTNPNVLNQQTTYSIQTIYNRKPYTINQATPFKQGINALALPANCEPSSNIDIMFVVDATNSMLDEINYLRTEVTDIINRTQNQHKNLTINLGSVFYTDFGDPNMIRVSPFSTKIKNTTDFMNRQQNFTGGYDWPEAVDSALAVALHEQKWSKNARTRLLFLIADAPSRNDPETLARMHQVTTEAAAMGVRIIPLACSGTPKSAEYLFRCLALATNGTYTFLTNDSGIGNDHIEPTTDHYDVTKLNNLLVQIIDQFTETAPCNQTYQPQQPTANVTVELPQDSNKTETPTASFVCYPNPTNGKVTIDLKGKIDFLFLADANGKILQRYSTENQTQIELNLGNYPSGIYFVQCPVDNDKWVAGRIVLVR